MRLRAPCTVAEERRAQWLRQLGEMKDASCPDTIVGVIGNTGVGKSSLLNALLGEASILPTSGSRGCTAAVVQLMYNSMLVSACDAADGGTTAASELHLPPRCRCPDVPVYLGMVEFISKQEWEAELEILIDECCNAEGNLYSVAPSESLGSAENLLAAWQKVETVYGQGTLTSRCRDGISKHRMLDILHGNARVNRLLSQTVRVDAGSVRAGGDDARSLVLGGEAVATSKALRARKAEWARQFRSSINEYVYRRGDGRQPQDWPLIRKVVLQGPWPVLSSGAQLVDLPGVRDANAARAKVAENFLQHCNNVWVVAPIKRAVDDGTAKELMGDNFKRRILMDGNYGNIAFICT
jgi:energy-coupling factor transporter ATP-binding protein EcfA2